MKIKTPSSSYPWIMVTIRKEDMYAYIYVIGLYLCFSNNANYWILLWFLAYNSIRKEDLLFWYLLFYRAKPRILLLMESFYSSEPRASTSKFCCFINALVLKCIHMKISVVLSLDSRSNSASPWKRSPLCWSHWQSRRRNLKKLDLPSMLCQFCRQNPAIYLE